MKIRLGWIWGIAVLVSVQAGWSQGRTTATTQPSLLYPETLESDARSSAFWFPPGNWSDKDLRSSEIVTTFFLEGSIGRLVIDDGVRIQPMSSARGRAKQRLVAAGGFRRSQSKQKPKQSILGLLRPRLRVRISIRPPLTAAPAKDGRTIERRSPKH